MCSISSCNASKGIYQFLVFIGIAQILCNVALCGVATQPSTSLSSSPYCGLYCLYAASKELGSPIPFVDLLKPQYVTSAQGSSLADIEQAAHDYGLNTLSFGNGTLTILRAAKNPVILHISPKPGAQEYTHFVMLLRCDGNRFSILDPGGDPLRVVDSTELLANWDKSGVVISRLPINTTQLFASSWLICLAWIFAIGGGMMFFRRFVFRSAFLTAAHPGVAGRFAIRQALVILAFTGTVALIYNCFSATGFIGNSSYVHAVEDAHIANFLPKVAISQIDSQVRGGAVLLDARFFKDYEAGHIPGAISVPIDLDPERREAILSGIHRDRSIVIYCEDKDCPFSQRMAIALKNVGYTNLALVDGGYEEWLMSKQIVASK